MPKPKQSSLPAYAVRTLSRRSGLPHAECLGLVDGVLKRRPLLKWVPPIAAVLAFCGWMFVFGRTTDILENTRLDLLAFLHRLGLLGYVIMFLLGIGFAFALAIIAGTVIPRSVLRHELSRCLSLPACFRCGYLLRGLEVRNSRIRCPECGGSSPVACRREAAS